MDSKNNIEKIIKKAKHLLSLSKKNNNPKEAQSAILHAQKLMAKYHIEMDSIDSLDEEAAKIKKDFVFSSTHMEWWEPILANIITSNFRTENVIRESVGFDEEAFQSSDSTGQGLDSFNNFFDTLFKKKDTIIFIGFDEDVKFAKEMFSLTRDAIIFYTDKFVKSEIDKENKKEKINAYIKGFLMGISNKLKAQAKEGKYELVVQTPEKVKDELNNMSIRQVRKKHLNQMTFCRLLRDFLKEVILIIKNVQLMKSKLKKAPFFMKRDYFYTYLVL